MGSYLRLIVVAIAAEVLLSIVISLGIYFGAPVFPLLMEGSPPTESASVSITGSVSSSTTATTGGQFAFSLPMGMPVLQDLKMPLSALYPGELQFGIVAVLLSIVAVIIQSYARAMYLGGLRSKLLHDQDADLLRCGNYYFKRMLGWNLVQWAAIGIAFLAGMFFVPLSLLLLFVYLFYAFTPYVFVLLDVRLSDSLAVAPGLFRRMFRKLLPLALLALLTTFLCSFIKLAPRPFDYYLALLVYIPVGTYLIHELMSRLVVQLREEGAGIPLLRMGPARQRKRMAGTAWLLLFLLVPLAGTAAASGYAYAPVTLGSQSAWTGTRFYTGFGHAFYRSEHQYATYGWRDIGANRLKLDLPDLADGREVEEIRGMADVTWVMRDEVYNPYTDGTNTTETIHRDKLHYRLGKETTGSGAIYYSSRVGTANLVTMDNERGGEPQSVEMLVSGDGSNVFVLVYPTRFRSVVQEVWRVSEDGQYLVPMTSRMNPNDFHYYWFRNEQPAVEDVLGMIGAKNKETLLMGEAQHLLATALQEADGWMVMELLGIIQHSDAKLMLPDWDATRWTAELRARYEGAAYEDVLGYLSRSEEEGQLQESLTPKVEGGHRYKTQIPFPNGDMTLVFESGADGKLRELTIDPSGELLE